MSRLAHAWMLAAALAAAPAAAQVRNWPSERPPQPLSARPAPFPPYEIRTLPNGLQVVVVRHTEQPVVTAQMLVKAGAAHDPAYKTGVANMVASLLDQGTARRTAGELADAIDSVGGELSVLAGTDVTFAQVTVMTDSFAFGLDTLSEVIRTPAFAPEEIERQRQQLRSGLRVSYEDPEYVANVVFDRLVFGFHPYGFPGDGTPDTIGAITRDDLVAFHRRYFAPGNSILAIVGDVDAAAAFAAAERVFGGWEPREVQTPTKFQPPPPTRRIVVIDMPDAVQTEIRAGHLGLPRRHKDYHALDLGVRILGGEGGNRLQQVLRTARGLTYGASADLESYQQTGIIRAETDTRFDMTGEALRLTIDEFNRIVRDDVEERELDEAKAYVTGSYPMGLETPGSISTKVLNALFHGLPLKELETQRDLVNAITPQQVSWVLREHLRPDRLSVVIVGPAAAVVPILRRMGAYRDAEVVPIGRLDLSAATFRKPDAPAAPAATGTGAPAPGAPAPSAAAPPAATPVPAAQPFDWGAAKVVVDRAVAAAGGLAALTRIRTIVASADTVLLTPGGPLRATTQTYVEYPARFRVDATTPGGEIVQAYADGQAWIKDPKGARDAPEPMRAEFASSVRRDWIALLVAAASGRLSGRLLPAERGDGGRPLDVVELWSDELPPVRMAVDRESGRLVRLTYQSTSRGGTETVTETFGTFRIVEGVMFPFSAVTNREGAPLLERTVSALHINQPIAAGWFDKPR